MATKITGFPRKKSVLALSSTEVHSSSKTTALAHDIASVAVYLEAIVSKKGVPRTARITVFETFLQENDSPDSPFSAAKKLVLTSNLLNAVSFIEPHNPELAHDFYETARHYMYCSDAACRRPHHTERRIEILKKFFTSLKN